MNTAIKLLLLPLALIVLFTQCRKDELEPGPDPEPEPEFEITDVNFLNALIKEGVDRDRDGEISIAEAEAVLSLDVSRNNISDMTGIEKFINLGTLDCRSNSLTSLDVSELRCGENQLTSLDVSNNTALNIVGGSG